MSWNALPVWIYQLYSERYQAAVLGGFPEEISAGFFPSQKQRYINPEQTDRFDSLIFEENFL